MVEGTIAMTKQVNRRVVLASGAGAAALIAAPAIATTSSDPVAKTAAGRVRGYVDNGVNVFKAIAYGADTSGANRFMAPKPPTPWAEIRDAKSWGSACPQLPAPAVAAWSSWASPQPVGENCLVLNVWTRGLRDGKKRPVMVWFHGGGYSSFSGSSQLYDGVRIANRGDVVLVTLNHRLNLFGYMYLTELGGAKYPANIGQLDLVQALNWVRDNIEEFGGDPANVMIFGESGGGGKTSTMLAMPAGHGLFHRAAIESGPGLMANTPENATKSAKALLDAAGAKSVEDLQKLPVAALLDAMGKTTHGLPFGFAPVLDPETLPRHPFVPDASPLSANVPVLIGYNKTETTVLFPPPNAFTLDWASLKTLLAPQLGAAADDIIAGFRKLRPTATASDLYFVITTERGMGAGSQTLAERKAAQHAAPVWLYRMEWETPVEGGRLRSPHSIEMPMVFDNVAYSASIIGTGAGEAQKIADVMSTAWINFARGGDPNGAGVPKWPSFDAEKRETMIFNVQSRAVSDPLRDERLLLAKAPPPQAGLPSSQRQRS